MCRGGGGGVGYIMPIPPPDATTCLPTMPSANDVARKLEGGGGRWGMLG